MTGKREFRWRRTPFFWLYGSVVIDFDSRRIRFENCLRTSGFWNLFPLREAECGFDDIQSFETYEQGGYRCGALVTSVGRNVFMDADIKDFDALIADLRRCVS
jgi:hypothetical protein